MASTDRTASDDRRLVRTSTPGIFKRVRADGSAAGYVAVFRAGGKQRKRVASTLAGARALKRAAEADEHRGEYQARSTLRFRAYLAEWIDRYEGTGRRGFREGTRAEYRRLLDQYAHRYFAADLRLVDVTPLDLARFVAWLSDEDVHGRRLAHQTVANAVTPVRAALSTARREGLIRNNPASGLALPARQSPAEDEDVDVKVLTREQLAELIRMTPPRHRLLLRLLASTGLRISEAVGLQCRHLHLEGERPHVKVRRAVVKRRVEAPKTRHGRRTVPLPWPLAGELRQHVGTLDDQSRGGLVFPSRERTPLDPDTLRRDWLRPAMEAIGAPGLGFHALRHTYASLQLARGANMLQLSRALGHHSPAFTLSVYCHLLDSDEVPALDVDAEVGWGNIRGNGPSRTQTN